MLSEQERATAEMLLKQLNMPPAFDWVEGWLRYFDKIEEGKEKWIHTNIQNLYIHMYLDMAIAFNKVKCVNIILDALEVPAQGLTLKERLAYYHIITKRG